VTNTVDLVLEAGTTRALEGDSYFPRVISHLEQALEAHQLDLVLLPSQNAPRFRQAGHTELLEPARPIIQMHLPLIFGRGEANPIGEGDTGPTVTPRIL
jgi:hypothetical protein